MYGVEGADWAKAGDALEAASGPAVSHAVTERARIATNAKMRVRRII